MAILSNGGLVASLAGLQRFMFCEVTFNTKFYGLTRGILV